MTFHQHAARIGLLVVGTALLLGWTLRHTEASFADGLRYIRQAERIDAGPGLMGSSGRSTTRSIRSTGDGRAALVRRRGPGLLAACRGRRSPADAWSCSSCPSIS